MSKRVRGRIAGRKRFNKLEGQWIAYPREMIESPAFRALSFQGRKILNRLEIEHCAHGGAENGRLPCRYRDFEVYGCRRKGISRALIEVGTLGFARIVTLGSRAYGDVPGKASTYLLTYIHTSQGAPTHDWKKIASVGDARKLIAASVAQHEQWLDDALGSPRRRQPKTKRQGAKCPGLGGEVPPNKAGVPGGEVPPTVRGAECHHLSISWVGSATNTVADDYQPKALLPCGSVRSGSLRRLLAQDIAQEQAANG
jgi:hypothetical protein